MTLKRFLVDVLPDGLVATLSLARKVGSGSRYAQVSFAQEGEDLLLARLFGHQATGFYVDVGAHHPVRFSNTLLLYRRGWSGINIDATPGVKAVFDRHRPRDTNLELAISNVRGHVPLHIFDEPALNSLDADLSRSAARSSRFGEPMVVDVPCAPLREVLQNHLPHSAQVIDLMSIDVEGHDLTVLESNDWDLYRPRVLLVELLESSLDELHLRPEIAFCRGVGYRAFAKLVNTVVLVRDEDLAAPGPGASGSAENVNDPS